MTIIHFPRLTRLDREHAKLIHLYYRKRRLQELTPPSLIDAMRRGELRPVQAHA